MGSAETDKRAERDALERFQVEAEELRLQLNALPLELERARAEAAEAEKQREVLFDAVKKRDLSLVELRDQVHWLGQSARRSGRAFPRFAFPRDVLKVLTVGVGSVLVAIWLFAWFSRVLR